MLLTSFFQKKGFYNYFFYCNKALAICSQDRIYKTREDFAWQCELCVGGFNNLQLAGVLQTEQMEYKDISFFMQFEHFERVVGIVNSANCTNKLTSLELEGFEIGKYVSYRVMRYFFRGYLKNDESELTVFKNFMIETLKFYYLFEEHLNKNKPDYAIIHNGSFNFGNVVRYLLELHSVPYITFETFIGENSIIYKKNGEVMRLRWDEEYYRFKNKNKDNWEIKDIEDKVAEFMSKIKDGSVMYARLNDLKTEQIESHEKFCVLFTNLNFDSAVIGRHTIYNKMTDWIIDTVRFWEENVTGVKLYIRIHPGEKKLVTPSNDFVNELFVNFSSEKVVIFDAESDISSYELIEKMLFGIVYSSTVGLEMLYYGKECVVAGDPFYLTTGLVDKFESTEEYCKKILELLKNEQNPISENRRSDLIEYLYFFYFMMVNRIEGSNFNLKKSTGFLNAKSINEVLEINQDFFYKISSTLFDQEKI
ncbi:MAG: hypothetical protein IAE91_00270 [Ignavibacteriaceae bacterium]|nr:hypothetical protein [Ignavibacteriaceae bacterium]